jgi:hypothetical protein
MIDMPVVNWPGRQVISPFDMTVHSQTTSDGDKPLWNGHAGRYSWRFRENNFSAARCGP